MKVSVELLKDFELQLAFHYATGYSGFDYFPEYCCWRAELKLSKVGLTAVSIVNDSNGSFRNRAYNKDFGDTTILRELRSENIGLKWDQDSNYVLYFQAFPEIEVTHPNLAIAFMKVMIKKELGDVLSDEDVEAMNLFKTKQRKGSPL